MAVDQSENGELPLESVGQRLARMREAAGMSRADVSDRTKIAERHLAAIEEDRFADLAGRTYAVGFSRSYARAIGLDEQEIAAAVREQLDREERALWPGPQRNTFEPGDPARVPPARLAWVAGLGALVVIVLIFVLWRSFLSPAATLPDLAMDQPPQAPATAQASDASTAAPAQGGTVVFTALEPDIWVKIYDQDGNQLFQKQMAQGETYTVPADAKGPQIWTGRPDALKITIDGREVEKLNEGPFSVKDVPVSAAALLSREAAASPAPAGQGAGPD